jgi:hypothetical protein
MLNPSRRLRLNGISYHGQAMMRGAGFALLFRDHPPSELTKQVLRFLGDLVRRAGFRLRHLVL